MKPGYERMHWLVDEVFANGSDEPSETLRSQVLARTSFADNPPFAVMQESIYASAGSGATNWAAEHERQRHPQFAESARPLLFTGEMMYPWIRTTGSLADVAEINRDQVHRWISEQSIGRPGGHDRGRMPP